MSSRRTQFKESLKKACVTNKSRDDVQCSIDIGISGMFVPTILVSVNFISILYYLLVNSWMFLVFITYCNINFILFYKYNAKVSN